VGRPVNPALIAALKELHPKSRRTASICAGSFILVRAGILNGRRATTHWRHTRLLSRAFSQISVEPDVIFVRDGDIYTSAGVSAGIDLALAIVEDDDGADLVRDVARSLVVYLKRAGGRRSSLRSWSQSRPGDHSCVRLPKPSPRTRPPPIAP
jgi:transcriptional regulator GlxA family with amidase domain